MAYYQSSASAPYRLRHNSYRQALSSIIEDPDTPDQSNDSMIKDKMERFKLPVPDQIDADEFNKLPNDKKFNKMMSTINLMCAKMVATDGLLNDPDIGMDGKITTVQTQADDLSSGYAELKWENAILKGLVQRQSKQIDTLTDKVSMLSIKSMEKNLIIRGIPGDTKKQNCKQDVMKFLKEKVEIEVDENEILVAHRRGPPLQDKPRPILVRCQLSLKERILSNAKNLKDKTNENGDSFYISRQLPEEAIEVNREIRETIREHKEKEKGLPIRERSKIEVKNKRVLIDGIAVEKQVLSPQPIELFADRAEREKRDKIKFATSDTASLQGSEFLGFAFKTGQLNEVKRAYRKIRTIHPSADHIMLAYYLKTTSGFQDDGEIGGASRLLKFLKENRPQNTVVFVVRYKNGKNLGPTRFEMIEQAAEQAVSRLK